MNCNFKELMALKNKFCEMSIDDTRTELKSLYGLYYPDTISQITGIDNKVIESYKYGYRKPSFGNYLILLELSKTV